VKFDYELSPMRCKKIIAEYKKLVKKETGKDFPQDPLMQLVAARDAVFRSWQNERAKTYRRINHIDDWIGTAVNVQAMVFGNLGENSGTGVGFTRNPATGEHVFFGEYLMNAQGEDVVSGVRTPSHQRAREGHAQGLRAAERHHARMEKHYRDMQDFEFTIQDGKLYMLQTRNGKRTGLAAVASPSTWCAKASSRRKKPSSASSPTSSTTSWFRASWKRARRLKCSPPVCRLRPARPSARSSSPPKKP
jgi:pyruvate, orthophosphate dikinase